MNKFSNTGDSQSGNLSIRDQGNWESEDYYGWAYSTEGDGEVFVGGEGDGSQGHGQEVAGGINLVGIKGLGEAFQAVFEGVDLDFGIAGP